VREEFVKAANLRLVRVASDSAEALQWVEEWWDEVSLNPNIGGLKLLLSLKSDSAMLLAKTD
jgi:hypothetical protein